jgi:hypothetical protein
MKASRANCVKADFVAQGLFESIIVGALAYFPRSETCVGRVKGVNRLLSLNVTPTLNCPNI